MALTHISNWLDPLPVPVDLADLVNFESGFGRLCGLVKIEPVKVAVLLKHVSRLNLHEAHASLLRLTAVEWGLHSLDVPCACNDCGYAANGNSKRAQGFEVGEVHLFLQPVKSICDLCAPLTKPCVWRDNENRDEWKAGGLLEDVHSSHLALALALGEFGLDAEVIGKRANLGVTRVALTVLYAQNGVVCDAG